MVKTLESSFSPNSRPSSTNLSLSTTNASFLLPPPQPPFSPVAGDEFQTIKNHSQNANRSRKNMGKYLRNNSKPTGDVSLIDMSSHGGVRTRAKTLALQKAAVSSGAGSYIQLRSRRLVKPTVSKRQKENRVPPKSNKGSYKRANSSGIKVTSGSSSESVKKSVDGDEEIHHEIAIRDAEVVPIGDEGSFADNMLENEGRGRSTRETTPCNLIRDPDTITTPGSSTKRAYTTNVSYRVQNSAPSHTPLTIEMDELFTEPEKQQQQLFIEKYNFDPVNDKPLPGRFEWVKMDDTKTVN